MACGTSEKSDTGVDCRLAQRAFPTFITAHEGPVAEREESASAMHSGSEQ